MLKKMTVAGAVTAGVLSAGFTGFAATAQAATVTATKPAAHHHHHCRAHSAGMGWACVVPGAPCETAAHGKTGTAVKGRQQYRCIKYSDGKWRWYKA